PRGRRRKAGTRNEFVIWRPILVFASRLRPSHWLLQDLRCRTLLHAMQLSSSGEQCLSSLVDQAIKVAQVVASLRAAGEEVVNLRERDLDHRHLREIKPKQEDRIEAAVTELVPELRLLEPMLELYGSIASSATPNGYAIGQVAGPSCAHAIFKLAARVAHGC